MTVKVYSTPTCPWCIRAKDYLRSKNVAFEDIDVSRTDGCHGDGTKSEPGAFGS